jgi:hypothetical protein
VVIRPWDSSRVNQLRSVEWGEHTRLFLSDDPDIDGSMRERAELYEEQCRGGYLFREGLIAVASHRDGDGFHVEVTLTRIGEIALTSLKNHLIWDNETLTVNLAWTIAEWRARLLDCTSPNAVIFSTIANSIHPALAPLRDELESLRLKVWERTLASIQKHNDRRFHEIEELPSPFYDLLKAEAMHHRMRIWTPQT